MSNNDMFVQSYTDLINLLYDITNEFSELKTYEEIQETLGVVNDITTQLKRMGETNILEIGGNIQKEEENISEEDIVVKEEIIGNNNEKFNNKKGKTKEVLKNVDGKRNK